MKDECINRTLIIDTRMARRDKKAFLSDQCKETEENSRMGKTREKTSRKIEITREYFMQRWAQ